jgi:drug/metabolite transporter (DMT)-like permease
MTALGRCGFALPALVLVERLERRRGAAPMTGRNRWLARAAGVCIAADLILWSHSIENIGAGLGTVITNLQVVLVALLAWAFLGERPRRSLAVALPVMVGGLVLVGGLAGGGGYGAHPALGVVFGVATAALYAVYILMLRQAAAGGPGRAAGGQAGGVARTAVAAPLLQATIGATAGAAVIGLALRDFRLGPAWPALGWLVLLALTSQVVGWLLITMSLPRLPAWLVGALLLVQPAGSVILSVIFLGERPTGPQFAGVAVILLGVLIAAWPGRGGRPARRGDRAGGAEPASVPLDPAAAKERMVAQPPQPPPGPGGGAARSAR